MMIQDDRTEEQKTLYPILVVATDSFMSGWGKADDGVSYAAWATDEKNLRDTLCWVERRGDMKRVRVVYGKYRPKAKGHLHIYISNYCKARD